MKLPGRRTIRRLPAPLAVLVAAGMVAGCASMPPFDDLHSGGVDATSGQIVVDDLWVNRTNGLAAGTDAPLRLTITDESRTTDDALVGVSTPVAEHVSLEQDGRAVTAIVVPAAGQVDLEWHTGVELQGLRQALTPGQWFPVTLTFRGAAPVTSFVTVGPLAASR